MKAVKQTHTHTHTQKALLYSTRYTLRRLALYDDQMLEQEAASMKDKNKQTKKNMRRLVTGTGSPDSTAKVK